MNSEDDSGPNIMNSEYEVNMNFSNLLDNLNQMLIPT